MSAPQQQMHSGITRRVFLSSTSRDLYAHRARVHDDLERMNQFAVDMAQFGAGGADATTVSLTEVASADIVVLIVAWRYGFVPEGQTYSVTRQEYEEALRRGLPVYVYLADPATEADDGPHSLFPATTRDPENAAQLQAFRALLRDSNRMTCDTFTTPEDLSSKVVTALARRLLREAPASRQALTRALELDRSGFKLGDDAAANFPYLTTPFQEEWDQATKALLEASRGDSGKRGIIVLGEANSGKTRLALEALMHALADWPVLRWSEAYTTADFPPSGSLPSSGFVLFLDDLPNYAPSTLRGPEGQLVKLFTNPAATLCALLESLTVRPVVIVATCRLEDEGRTQAELGWLFRQLGPISLPQFSPKPADAQAQRIISEFHANGATHIQEWDGTLGSLVLGLSTKREQYEELKVRRSPAVEVLRAMKLLTLAEIYVQTERRLRAVCAGVFSQWAIANDERTWQDAVEELLRLQFVQIAKTESKVDRSLTLVIRKDSYFDADKVVTDYPNPYDPSQLERHIAQLQRILGELGDANGLYSLGGVFYRRQHNDRALAVLDQVLALVPENASVWRSKGIVLARLDRYEEAVVALDQALIKSPEDTFTWIAKGFVLGELDRDEEAVVAYDEALARNPENAELWHNKGTALNSLDRYVEALAALEQALARDPENVATWVAKAIALNSLGRYEDALAACNEALPQDPVNSDVWAATGDALNGWGRYEEAVTAYEKALVRDPENNRIWHNKGIALAKLNRTEEALVAYDEALARNPETVATWRKKALALGWLGRNEEALVALDQALVRDPRDANTWNNKGAVLRSLGRFEEALAAYEEALARDPELTLSREGKAQALRALGRAPEADAS